MIYTAHYDHLGIVPGMPGDNIYNGAQDNATGCGILLEIARVFAAARQAAKRSTVFRCRHRGGAGSARFGISSASIRPVPAKEISLDLNYDDVPPLGVPEEVNVAGAERTTFYPTVESTAKEFGLDDRARLATRRRPLLPLRPLQPGARRRARVLHRRRRSSTRATTASGACSRRKDYVAKHYHQPSDEYHPDMDFRGDAVMARFGIALGWLAADQPTLIGWRPGDEFAKVRAASN